MKFTDDSLIKVAIPYKDLPPPGSSSSSTASFVVPSGGNDPRPEQTTRKKSLVGKLGSRFSLSSPSSSSSSSDKSENKKAGFRMIEMTRREYLMYWAKDEQGRYIGTEPKGRGAEIWRERGY